MYYRHRVYAPTIGRFSSADPLGFIDGQNEWIYCSNNAINLYDYLGLAGLLTIYSDSMSGDTSSGSGHSWISYCPNNTGTVTTYGTFGNNPRGLGNGLHENLELGRAGTMRTAYIDDGGEANLMKTISKYKDEGESGWKLFNPCSGFASDAWKSATGESLQDRYWFGVSTPTHLEQSILKANDWSNHGFFMPTESPPCCSCCSSGSEGSSW